MEFAVPLSLAMQSRVAWCLTGIHFLSSAASTSWPQSPFEDPSILSGICEKVRLPLVEPESARRQRWNVRNSCISFGVSNMGDCILCPNRCCTCRVAL
eukprot:4565180-Amphidinium_carterae.1